MSIFFILPVDCSGEIFSRFFLLSFSVGIVSIFYKYLTEDVHTFPLVHCIKRGRERETETETVEKKEKEREREKDTNILAFSLSSSFSHSTTDTEVGRRKRERERKKLSTIRNSCCLQQQQQM